MGLRPRVVMAMMCTVWLVTSCSGSDDGGESPTTGPASPPITMFDQGSGFNGIVRSIALVLDGSGDVYVGGPFSSYNEMVAHEIVRLNENGTPDPAFMTGTAFERIPLPGAFSGVATLALAPQDTRKLYVGGNLRRYNGTAVPSLVRLNPDGSLDQTFMTGSGVPALSDGTAVEVVVPAGDGTDDVYAGGRILSYDGQPVQFGLIRIHESGALDTTLVPAVPFVTMLVAPAQDGSGDIIVSGFQQPPEPGVRLLRLDRNGGLVQNFRPPSDLDDVVLVAVPVGDGSKDLYIGGAFTRYNGTNVNRFARIHANGSLASIAGGPPTP